MFAEKIKELEAAGVQAIWAGQKDSEWKWVDNVAAKLDAAAGSGSGGSDSAAAAAAARGPTPGERFRAAVQAVRADDVHGELVSTALYRIWSKACAVYKARAKGPAELRPLGRKGRR